MFILSHYDTLIIDSYYLLLKCPVLLDHYIIRNGQFRQETFLPDWAKNLLENYL